MLAVRQMIREALAEDAGRRQPRASGSYSLRDLHAMGPFQRLTGGFPIFACDPYLIEPDIAQSDQEFADRLKKEISGLANFSFEQWGMALAGCAVTSLLMASEPKEWAYYGFDVYLVSRDPKESITKFRQHLLDWWGPRMHQYRTKTHITFYRWGFKPVRVWLQAYTQWSEILHSTSVGSDAVLWTGKEIRLSRLGVFAVHYGANVVNLNTKRGHHEEKLIHYFHRGFDIVVPGLDLSAIDSDFRTIDLPFLSAKIEEIDGSIIRCEDVYIPGINAETSEFNDFEKFHIPTDLMCRNLEAINSNKPGQLGIDSVPGPGTFATPEIDMTQVEKFIHSFFSDGKVDLLKLKRVLGEKTAAALTAEFIYSSELKDGVVTTLAERLRDQLQRIGMPFEIAPVDISTFIEISPRSPAEWLGAYHG